jgi:hypothetical protein
MDAAAINRSQILHSLSLCVMCKSISAAQSQKLNHHGETPPPASGVITESQKNYYSFRWFTLFRLRARECKRPDSGLLQIIYWRAALSAESTQARTHPQTTHIQPATRAWSKFQQRDGWKNCIIYSSPPMQRANSRIFLSLCAHYSHLERVAYRSLATPARV